MVGTGVEIEHVRAGVQGAAESQCPQPVNGYGLVLWVPEMIEELARLRAEDIDLPIAEVADQDVVAKLAEVKGRLDYAPRRIEEAVRSKAPDQMSVGIEDVHEAETLAMHRVMLGRILLGIGDEEIAVDARNAERSVAHR